MLREQITDWGTANFHEPATDGAIAAAEAALGTKLPDEILDLLRETDGVDGEYGLALVWPAERIGKENAHFRSDQTFKDLYLPFEGLVFFSDGGNGDQFAISLRGPQDIYVWNHEDDSRTWVASTLVEFLRRWMTGELQI